MSRLAAFDDYIQQAMHSWHCPGVAIVVVRGDEILHQGAYGLSDVEQGIAMTAETRFAMASVTKSVTAMSAALLVDEGLLAWDKPVREYMPEFILHDPYVTQHVTVRDMLSHRTGLPRHDLSAWRLKLSRADYIERMQHFRFSATFREKFQYNNLMYYAIAYLVEKLAGQKWEDFVHERIFAPLGMTASNFVPEPLQTDQVNAKGYQVDRDDTGAAQGLKYMPFGEHTELSPGAAGALFSTLADLTRWLKVHVNGGMLDDFRLVAPDTLKQMHLPQTIIPGGGYKEAMFDNTLFAYGMGWFIEPYAGKTLVHHGGNVEGHSLIVGFVPQEQVGVVALTNIGLLPLRDVLLYESIDRGLELPAQDWNRKYHNLFDPLIEAEAKGKQTTAQEQIAGAPPSHPLSTYVGTYTTDGYPDFAVRMTEEGELQACLVDSLAWSTFRHYHYNVFEWHMADFDYWSKLHFLINDNGDVDAISIPIEPMVDNVVFTRKQPKLIAELITALVGEYDSPLDGVTYTITVQQNKLYFTETGTPAQEIKPYKVDADTVGFRLKRVRLDFTREDGQITQLSLKTPSMTLEAPRKV